MASLNAAGMSVCSGETTPIRMVAVWSRSDWTRVDISIIQVPFTYYFINHTCIPWLNGTSDRRGQRKHRESVFWGRFQNEFLGSLAGPSAKALVGAKWACVCCA